MAIRVAGDSVRAFVLPRSPGKPETLFRTKKNIVPGSPERHIEKFSRAKYSSGS
jgi:hypothetical protein